MNSTERWPSLHPLPVGQSDRFDDLRAAYVTRLRTDLATLKRLRARLDRTAESGVPLLHEDIRRTAHSMAGAAVMFDASLVAQAAGTLEDAARAVSVAPWTDTGAARTALEALIRVLQTYSA